MEMENYYNSCGFIFNDRAFQLILKCGLFEFDYITHDTICDIMDMVLKMITRTMWR